MKPPIFVRELSKEERESLEAGLRSRETFVMRRSLAPRLRSACTPPSTRTRPSGCGQCCTARRGSSGMRRACGLWRWQQRPPSRRVSPKRGSRGRPSAPPSRVFWAYAGSGPSGGSPPQTPCTNEKKAARPTDGDGRRRPSVGHRLYGRMLVEPGSAAHLERLLRGGRAPSHDPTVGRQGRPRPEGHLLLRPLPSTARRRHVDKVRRRQAGFFHNHAVPLVELRGARKGWQEDPSSHLGQRKLAHLQGGFFLMMRRPPRS